ncbi:wings apart-like protein regulation of heterochromatin-domain-containing protein [Paraphoma chrysanthemicola]|uniref:Wings apart-like protein regulation of heterochromatin-domain-containing protein n=1 Tax=Paraphoma chrysanthemicola TaxID=798071 RepID=A0A8K0VZS3_9PLEO|nr:wings apart-like protein regulation of heterochromatin-domain-containing protein [Paraphoma chrysanthemicola]
MSTAFTAPDRRKKAVTYGKSSRVASVPPPTHGNDATSPERPRKHALPPAGALKKNSLTGSGLGSSNISTNTVRADIFDVPSEDEFAQTTVKPAKRLLTKRRSPSEEHAPAVPTRAPKKNVQSSRLSPALRQPDTAEATGALTKKLQKPAPLSARTLVSTTDLSIQPKVRRGRTPQPVQEHRQGNQAGQEIKRVGGTEKEKENVRAATPALPGPSATTRVKVPAIPLARLARANVTAKSGREHDVFDLPSSGDESHLPTPKAPRHAPIAIRKKYATVTEAGRGVSAKDSIESEDSEALKKRKRKGSTSSLIAPKVTGARALDHSLPQHSRKQQKKENSVPQVQTVQQLPITTATTEAQSAVSLINKPKRTRVRTVPVVNRAPMVKGQSSPATLHGMLPQRHAPSSVPVTEQPEASVLEDDTMYEIPEPSSTPQRISTNPNSGTVTPRQKALFGSLLGTSSASATPMPTISRLQLTDRKPSSLLGSLSRSKSDITHGSESRKVRLLAKLKPERESSNDDSSESGSESGSDGEEAERKTSKAALGTSKKHGAQPNQTYKSRPDDMEVDKEVAPDSQTSQATSGFGARPKFTYAKSRSYLQEANPEDALLMSMDLDDPVAFSQTRDSQVEEEDETSQVRPNHELKKGGQSKTFQWENQMLIDDIAVKSSNSIRRSTILELCTQMAGESFTLNLLDSSLAHQFLKNVSSSGDIIFDFAVAAAMAFMIQARPTSAVLEEIAHSPAKETLLTLLSNDVDILKLAKMRKTNLSRLAQDSVAAFHAVVLDRPFWTGSKPRTLSPQLVALKSLDLLVLELRMTGSIESVLTQDIVSRLVDIASTTLERPKGDSGNEDNKLILDSIFSILEASSLAPSHQTFWPSQTLKRLSKVLSVTFEFGDTTNTTLAVKMCMNLTNNKPKACQHFSDASFVQSLVQSVVDRFKLLETDTDELERNKTLDTLILSLGAMINLTEHSDRARANVDDKQRLIETLVKTFVDGSIRTAQATLIQETQASVAVGYLSVLLGNMCLNDSTKNKIRAQLPGRQLTILVEKIREFLQVHEHANRKAKHFEGDEGQDKWRNYTARIMLVVDALEKDEA